MYQAKYDKWIKYPNGAIVPHDSIEVVDFLKPCIHKLVYDSSTYIWQLRENQFIHDDLIFHESEEYNIVLEEIQSFWNMKSEYEKYDYIHKRGILMAGSPGNGKTSLINLCLDWYFKNVKGIAISISSYEELIGYKDFHKSKFRSIEPNTPLICIFEDIDGYIHESSDAESILLNLLDGNNQINNVMYIATTNYPERITERLSRPGRFDIKVEVKYPTRKEREVYLKNKLYNQDNFKDWLDQTENRSFAFISEMVKQFNIYKKPLGEILVKLENYANIAKSSTSFNKSKKKIGF